MILTHTAPRAKLCILLDAKHYVNNKAAESRQEKSTALPQRK